MTAKTRHFEVPSWHLGGPQCEPTRGTHARLIFAVAGPRVERVTVVVSKRHATELRDALAQTLARLDNVPPVGEPSRTPRVLGGTGAENYLAGWALARCRAVVGDTPLAGDVLRGFVAYHRATVRGDATNDDAALRAWREGVPL